MQLAMLSPSTYLLLPLAVTSSALRLGTRPVVMLACHAVAPRQAGHCLRTAMRRRAAAAACPTRRGQPCGSCRCSSCWRAGKAALCLADGECLQVLLQVHQVVPAGRLHYVVGCIAELSKALGAGLGLLRVLL